MKMMEIKRIETVRDSLYPLFKALYADSFPVFEQRTEVQQIAAFEKQHYHLELYYEEDLFLGFIAWWSYGTYIYIEHYAIHVSLRGQGYGSRILQSFIASHPAIILLEIDPIVDEKSAARLRFYQKCGFYENDYPHTHPPYREGYHAHPLLVLTTQRSITPAEYQQFVADLNDNVMRF